MQSGGCKAQRGPPPRTQGVTNLVSSRVVLESPGIESDTLVGERDQTPVDDLEYHGAR